jgi:hypothetical protein
MSNKIVLNKTVYNKDVYNKMIDTSFKQLGVKTIQQQLDETPTVDYFFQLYNELFYDIPELGETNSHEYLITKSSEYIDFQQNLEEIEALQAEIASLRTELLEEQKKVIELQTKQ